MCSRKSLLYSVVEAFYAHIGSVRGSRNVISREYDLRDFTGIRASQFDIEIRRGDDFSVVVRADDNLLGLIRVFKRGQALRLRTVRHTWLRSPYTLEATITMPELRHIELSGAALVHVSGFRYLKDLTLALTGASELRGSISAGEIDVMAAGSSKARLEGEASSVTIEASGASRINFANLTTKTARLTLSGASRARMHVTGQVTTAELSGASRLLYTGGPVLGDVRTNGASRIDSAE